MSKKKSNNRTSFSAPQQKGLGDSVNHPKHYNSHPSGVECIDIVRHYNFNVGNVFKYLWRHGLKHEQGINDRQKAIEDLRKAQFYLNDEIERLEHEAVGNDTEYLREAAKSAAVHFSEFSDFAKNISKLLNSEGSLCHKECSGRENPSSGNNPSKSIGVIDVTFSGDIPPTTLNNVKEFLRSVAFNERGGIICRSRIKE